MQGNYNKFNAYHNIPLLYSFVSSKKKTYLLHNNKLILSFEETIIIQIKNIIFTIILN